MSHVKLVYDSDRGVMVPKDGGDQATTRRKNRRVLYVDDSRTSSYVTSKMLRQFGYDISHFTTGEEALDAVLERDFDVLLTDLNMSGNGGLNGDDLIRIIRNCGHPEKATLPIIVITGSSDGKTVEGLYSAGADEVMVKPVKGRELDAVIKNLIAVREGNGELADEDEATHQEFSPYEAPPGTTIEDDQAADNPPVDGTVSSETESPVMESPSDEDGIEAPLLDQAVTVQGYGSRGEGQAPPNADDEIPLLQDSVGEFGSSVGTEDTLQTQKAETDQPETPAPTPAQQASDELDKLLDGFLDEPEPGPVAEKPVVKEPPAPETREPAQPTQFEWQRVMTGQVEPRPDPGPAPQPAAPAPSAATPSTPSAQDNPLLALLDDFDTVKGSAAPAPAFKRPKTTTPKLPSRTVMLVALAVVGIAALIWGFGEPVRDVRLVAVEQGMIYESISVPGKVVSKRKVDLSAYYPGQITSVEVKEGDRVSKGKVLVRLDDREARTRVNRAQASLMSTQEEVARTSNLQERLQRALDLGAVSRQMVEDAEGEWRAASARQSVAEEELSAAKLALERMSIVAPFDGVVTALKAHAGEWTSPPDAMLSLVDVTQREVELKVDSADSSRLRLEQPVVLSSEAFPGKSWDETITRIAPATNRDSKANTIDVYVSLGRDAPELRTGQQVDAEIRTRIKEHALKVPFQALFTRDGQTVVAVVENGRIVFVPVTTGIEDFSHVEIVKGLRLGQEVVVGGGQELDEGDKVRLAG